MKFASNLFKFVDVIGPQITFKYKNNSRVQTIFGGLLSLVLFMVGSLGFGYFSRDMFFRTNPITKQNSLAADGKVFPFAEYPLAIVITDNMIKAIEPGNPLYNSIELIPQYYLSSMENNTSKVEIGNFGTKPCSKDYFGKFQNQYGSAVNAGSVCIDYSKTYNLDGSSSVIDPYFYENKTSSESGLIDIKVRLCDEGKKPGCSKPLLEEGQIHVFVYILNEMVNFEDYSSPIEQQIDFIGSTVSPGLFSRKLSRVSLNRLITDDGYMLNETSTTEFMTTALFDTQIASYNHVTRELYAFQLNLAINETVLERRYVKIQEILANIGGFVKLLLFVASLLTRYCSLYSFYMDFGKEINIMFKEVKHGSQGTKLNELTKPSYKSVSQSNNDFMRAASVKTNTIDTEIGYLRFFKSLFVQNKKKSESYSVFKFLDVSYLARKMIEQENKS